MPRLRPLPNSESDGTAKPLKVNSRGRLNAQFVEDLAEKWEQHGAEVLEHVRLKSPEKFAQLAADLLPKQVEVEASIGSFAHVQSLEEMRPILVNLIIENGWAGDVIARMGSPIIETKAIEVSKDAA